MKKVPKSAAQRDQNLKVRDRVMVVTALCSALLELCHTAVLASRLLPFPVDVAVPGPRFKSQNLRGCSELSVTPAPGTPYHHTDTHADKTTTPVK